MVDAERKKNKKKKILLFDGYHTPSSPDTQPRFPTRIRGSGRDADAAMFTFRGARFTSRPPENATTDSHTCVPVLRPHSRHLALPRIFTCARGLTGLQDGCHLSTLLLSFRYHHSAPVQTLSILTVILSSRHHFPPGIHHYPCGARHCSCRSDTSNTNEVLGLVFWCASSLARRPLLFHSTFFNSSETHHLI